MQGVPLAVALLRYDWIPMAPHPEPFHLSFVTPFEHQGSGRVDVTLDLDAPPPDQLVVAEDGARTAMYIPALIRAGGTTPPTTVVTGDVYGLARQMIAIYQVNGDDRGWTNVCFPAWLLTGEDPGPRVCPDEPIVLKVDALPRWELGLLASIHFPAPVARGQFYLALRQEYLAAGEPPIRLNSFSAPAVGGRRVSLDVTLPDLRDQNMPGITFGRLMVYGSNGDCVTAPADGTLVWMESLHPEFWLAGAPLPPGYTLVADSSFDDRPKLVAVDVSFSATDSSGSVCMPGASGQFSLVTRGLEEGQARMIHYEVPVPTGLRDEDFGVELIHRGKALDLVESTQWPGAGDTTKCARIEVTIGGLNQGLHHLWVWQSDPGDGGAKNKIADWALMVASGLNFAPRPMMSQELSYVVGKQSICDDAPPPCGVGNNDGPWECDVTEQHTWGLCPEDCNELPLDTDDLWPGDFCGDGVCDAIELWEGSCEQDCLPGCGDGQCDTNENEIATCPPDCPYSCHGDGREPCLPQDRFYCPEQCRLPCEDEICGLGPGPGGFEHCDQECANCVGLDRCDPNLPTCVMPCMVYAPDHGD